MAAAHLCPDPLPTIEWEHKVCTSYKQSLFTVVSGCPVPSISGWRKPHSAILLLSDDYECRQSEVAAE